MRCPSCGSEISGGRLACPVCHTLVHREELERLAGEARAAREAGEVRRELVALRHALTLLPPDARQYAVISERVASLSDRLDEGGGSGAGERPGWTKQAGVLGGVALLLWKGKAVIAFLLTKGKLLLGGLSKSGTVFSMALSFGLYWGLFGWPFALGLVLSIYVHEMGHVAALRHYGIPASAPMFIPGLGAVVRAKMHLATAREDARVGLAGPIWGLGAAVVAYGIFFAVGHPLWAAIAKFGAWINLFNLLPVWQLDGGRAFKALTRAQRLTVAAAMGGMWWWTGEGLLVLLALVAVIVGLGRGAPKEGDTLSFAQMLGLVVILSLMSAIPIPID